jgi:hypothetical protein
MNRLEHESLCKTRNDNDPLLPKGRGRCFDIGSGGGCGVECPAFLDGECPEPQELNLTEIIEAHGEDASIVLSKYNCFEAIQL